MSFAVSRGGSLLIVGPSGCGKSTLALCLNGAVPHFVEGPLDGRVRIAGRDTRASSMSEMAQRVGVVFQDPEAQFCMLTLEEEVAFGLENLAVPRDEMDARIDEALGWVDLLDRRHDRIERLSGGQKQRLALACVLAQRPEVLVFDEPTAQLDPAGAAEVLSLLARLRAQGRYTLVIIEHRLDDLMPLVDDVLVLTQAGEVETHGASRRVMRDWGDWLTAAGVWVPQVSELATQLRHRGLCLEPFPLTIDETANALRSHLGWQPPRDPDRPATESHSGRGPAGQAFIDVDRLSFTYPRTDRPALDDVSLRLNQGELAVVVGANGAGKSTLARHLVRLLPPQPNRVRLEGVDLALARSAEVARAVGYVFQYPEHQFIGRSVLDDVAFGPRRAGFKEAEAVAIAQAILGEFGLGGLALAHPYSLSHGEQRRLSVAAMLVLGQRGLFLDEPTFGQDRRSADVLLDKLTDLANTGRAIVGITHDMRLVAERAERAIAMADGQVIFDGSPRSLFASESVLARAHLRPPPLVQVSQRLGLSTTWLQISDVLAGLARPEAAAR